MLTIPEELAVRTLSATEEWQISRWYQGRRTSSSNEDAHISSIADYAILREEAGQSDDSGKNDHQYALVCRCGEELERWTLWNGFVMDTPEEVFDYLTGNDAFHRMDTC